MCSEQVLLDCSKRAEQEQQQQDSIKRKMPMRPQPSTKTIGNQEILREREIVSLQRACQ